MDEFWAKIRFWRDHRWTPDRMSDYLDGELAPEERARVERHVGECVECRRVIAGLRLVVEALHLFPAPEPGGDATGLVGSVRARLAEPEPSDGSRGSKGA
jgi:anti-sigma factor RsiW